MSLRITDDCTCCDACASECPNEAISAGDTAYRIDPDRCTECAGADDSPRCQSVCPAESIVAGVAETLAQLQAKYQFLHG